MLIAAKNALRYARRFARAEGVILGRFRLIPGTGDSDLGCEWFADAIRGDGHATVWLPVGDSNRNEALRTCTICRSFQGYIFGITVRTPR